MNLSTLSGPELRQLLDTARTRGQAQLSYQILQEMEARRASPGRSRGLFRKRRASAEPMALVLDAEPEDPEGDIPPMPLWRAPAREPDAAQEPPAARLALKSARASSAAPLGRRKTGPRAAPAPDVGSPAEPIPPSAPREPSRPRNAWTSPPEEPPPSTAAPPPRRASRGSSAGWFAVGLAAGTVLGVGVSELWRDAPPAAPAQAPVETADLAPAAAPAIPPPAAPEPGPTTEPAPAEADTAAPADAPPDADRVVETLGEPEPSPDAVDLAETPQDACAAQPTPADRTICGDPELQRLQRELRRAYARALNAHEDRDLLRQRQLAWRDARSAISNSDRLARLYEDRIRRLNAATEAARQAR